MEALNKTTVGTKGEILPKKFLREIAGIKPGDLVVIEALPGELHIRKVLTVDEAFALPVIAKGTPEQIEHEIIAEANMEENI